MSKEILNKLLDKFERSKQKENIHISIRLTKKTLPQYYDLNSDKYESINQDLQKEEKLGYINLDWKDNRPGHIVERVRLNLIKVDEIYKFLNRNPIKLNIKKIINNLKEELNRYSDSEITKNFIEYIISNLEKGKSISEYLDLNKFSEFSEFLSILYKIEKNEELLFLREFSGKITGDTKFIENNLNKFINILYNFSDLFDSKDKEIILNYFNIYTNPIYVFLKGKVIIQLNKQDLDLTNLSNGIAISSQDLNKLNFKYIKKVITIENLTTYNRFPLEKDTLVIYSRGFVNNQLIKIIKKISTINQNCRFFHFGDIDVGGFLILLDLIKKTKLNFYPYLMSKSVLEKYKKYAKSITINDKKRLENLINFLETYKLDNQIKEIIVDSLNEIKNKGLKLEQEVINMVDLERLC